MGLEQEDFAQLLRDATGDPRWTQQKISRLEKRKTKFRDDDIKAVAEVQGMPYQYYLDGPEAAYRRMREAGLSQKVIPLRKQSARTLAVATPARRVA